LPLSFLSRLQFLTEALFSTLRPELNDESLEETEDEVHVMALPSQKVQRPVLGFEKPIQKGTSTDRGNSLTDAMTSERLKETLLLGSETPSKQPLQMILFSDRRYGGHYRRDD
jgi:hypothetical protein